MALSCNNVKDYVVLCGDGALSSDTVKDIKEHLDGCEDCRKYYEECGITELPGRSIKCEIAEKLSVPAVKRVLAAAGAAAALAGAVYAAFKLLGGKDK